MKNISIIFSKRTNFNLFSTLIMWGLKTPFSHVAIKVADEGTGQAMIAQASGLSVNYVSEEEFLSVETVIYQKDIQVSDAVYLAGKKWINSQLGKPYNIAAIFGFALQILLGMIGIKISNPFKEDGSSYVCSQLAAAYISECEKISLDVTNMTPLALYQVMPSLPEVWQ